MRGLLPMFPTTCIALVVLASLAGAVGEEAAPQNDWMVHMDRGTGGWRYLPDRPVLVPGGTLQLMVFGDGQFSIVLDDDPSRAADIASTTGTIRTAELSAPATPGEYPFHDRYRPETRGVLVVRAQQAPPPEIGVVPGGYEARFAPERLEVAAGSTVRFTANGTFGHNLQAVDGSFSAGDLKPGESATFTAPTTPGEYPFECRFHKGQGMVGVLVVGAPASAPSSPSPTPASEPTREDVPDIGLGALLLILGSVAAALAVAARRRA